MAEDDVWYAEEMSIPDRDGGWLWVKTPGLHCMHLVATPAFELFSVRVCHKYFGRLDTCDIYGTIFIDDEDGTSHQLYCRSPYDPQTLTPEHNLLSIYVPDECAAASTTWSSMSFDLKDKSRGDFVIADQVLCFDKLASYNDQVNVLQLDGGFVFVTFAALRAALVAIVEITLIKINGRSTASVDLSGKIVARYGNTYGLRFPGVMLFNTPSNQPVNAVCNVPIELSRDVVLVPAYSFLRIDLQLSQCHVYQQDDIIGTAEILAGHAGSSDHFDVKAKDFVIRVNVDWYHPYQYLDDAEQPLKHPKIPDLLAAEVSRHRYNRFEVLPLLEIFSVMIYHDTNSVLRIAGSLKACHNQYKYFFSRNELNPVIISKNMETIPIGFSSLSCCEMYEELSIMLDLRDVEGRVSIQGNLGWCMNAINRPITWYDRRICSVIPGIHGYALVFYTIFSKAVQATIKVSFVCSPYPDTSHCVHGTIVARYSNQVYSTEYDKSNYQSVLFRGNSSGLKSGCILPLSKSVLPVPVDACLIVGVDLYARSLSDELPREHLKKDIEFGIVPGACICQRIKIKNYCIEVSLEWCNYGKTSVEDFEIFRNSIDSD